MNVLCDIDCEMMPLKPEIFDSPQGWGHTANEHGIDAAKQEIELYLQQNSGLSSYWRSILNFRIGQILSLQNNPESLLWFQESFFGNPEWDSYVGATIAFTQKNPFGVSCALKDLRSMGLTDRNETIRKVKKLQWLLTIGAFDYRGFIQPLRVLRTSKE